MLRAADGQVFAQGVVVDPTVASAPLADSRLIYLNRGGVTVSQGASDARANRSSLASRAATIPAWYPDEVLWADTIDCLRDLFAPFDVRFTDTDPGNVSHIEAVFGGNATMLGLPVRASGASPMSTSCRVVENAMVFAFTDDLPANARTICEVMAQEIAHSYGLDHELLASDPMTYLSYNGHRAFQDTLAACGEGSSRPCGVPGYTKCRDQQNSYALLLERLGPAASTTDDLPDAPPADPDPTTATNEIGCSAATPPGSLVLALLAVAWRRKRPTRSAR